ncbi:MAG: hypothetical protein PVH19_06865 [Planctomycetia bacterium]|jgi:hypothetical protein
MKALKGILLSVVVLFCAAAETAVAEMDRVETATARAADFLVKVSKPNGMFQYRINMNPEVVVKPKYNILRHSGAIYAMGMQYAVKPDPKLRAAMERSAKYLRDEALAPIEGQPDTLGIWSDPKVNGSKSPRQVKLGGSGLGLVALMSMERIKPGFTPIKKLRGLGNSIVFMQRKDGGFCSKYVPSEGGLQEGWVSLYYPGEAALGLVMLYEMDRSPKWLNGACRTLEYLAKTRKGSYVVPADHWALLATARLMKISRDKRLPVSEELLINHAVQICESIMMTQDLESRDPQKYGGFVRDGRTTPTATRLEGLLAALTFIPKNHKIYPRLEKSVDAGIAFLLQSQIKSDRYQGAFPRAVATLDGYGSKVASFNRRVTEIRIDYVQHALSAMIQYREYQKIRNR